MYAIFYMCNLKYKKSLEILEKGRQFWLSYLDHEILRINIMHLFWIKTYLLNMENIFNTENKLIYELQAWVEVLIYWWTN